MMKYDREKHMESKVYLTESIRSRVFTFMKKNPNANIIQVYDEFPNIKKDLLKYYKWLFKKIYINTIDWEHMYNLYRVFKYKAKVIKQLSEKESDAVDYFNKLVSENYRGGKK